MLVAACQFAPVLKSPDVNLRTMTTMVRAAASNGAKLIVLPELATSGYTLMSEEEARPLAEVLTDPKHAGAGDRQTNSMGAMMGLASELDVAIVWGLIREDPGTRHLYNSQVMALPSGAWTSMDKINRWGNDYIWAKPGKISPPIMEYMGKNLGMLICRDIRDKSKGVKDFYEPGDTDIVCFSANWGDGGFPSGTWVEFAEDNHTTLIVSNRYGQESLNNFGEGGICVIEPTGKVHCEGFVCNQPCIVYADVD